MGPLRETIPLLSHAKTWRLFVSIFAGCLKFKHYSSYSGNLIFSVDAQSVVVENSLLQ